MRVPTGIMSLKIKGGVKEVDKFCNSVKNIKFSESFGGTKTIMNYSFKQTHRFATEEEKRMEGITDNFFRLSVGLEEPEDILEELDYALNSMYK